MRRAIKRSILKKYSKNRNKIHSNIIVGILDYLIDFLFPKEDEIFLKSAFKAVFGYELDLQNPKTFNEKMHWLKLNDRSKLHTICADKLLVRDYVAEQIGEKYLIPLLYSTKKTSEITPKKLPDFPVIIKTNHDSGSTFIINNKKEYDWQNLRNKLQNSLNNNFYYAGREWPYKHIPPRIIIEKLITQKDDSIPNDYKFYCSNGVVHYIQIEIDRGGSGHSRNIYDLNWNLLDINRGISASNNPEPRPKRLTEMISLCEKLSAPFLFARVDLYYVDDELIYFGEITFTPAGGLTPFEPNKWDKIFGDTISLPINN